MIAFIFLLNTVFFKFQNLYFPTGCFLGRLLFSFREKLSHFFHSMIWVYFNVFAFSQAYERCQLVEEQDLQFPIGTFKPKRNEFSIVLFRVFHLENFFFHLKWNGENSYFIFTTWKDKESLCYLRADNSNNKSIECE